MSSYSMILLVLVLAFLFDHSLYKGNIGFYLTTRQKKLIFSFVYAAIVAGSIACSSSSLNFFSVFDAKMNTPVKASKMEMAERIVTSFVEFLTRLTAEATESATDGKVDVLSSPSDLQSSSPPWNNMG